MDDSPCPVDGVNSLWGAAGEAAAGGGTGDITDDFNAGTLTRTAFTVTHDGGSILAFPNCNAVNTLDGTGYLRLVFNDPADFVTFSSPITALGYEVNPRSGEVGVVFAFAVNGTAAGTYSLPATAGAALALLADVPLLRRQESGRRSA